MQQLVPTCVVVAAAGLLAACGSVEKLPPSAADAGVDVAISPNTPVTVTVLTTAGDGTPDPTAKVVFQDPDGNVVSDGQVDAMGHAQAMLPRGGRVSAIRTTTDTPANLTGSITTIMGAKPGDDLTFGIKASATIANQGGATTMTASFPPAPGATNYSFFTPCGLTKTTTSPVTLSFRDSCHGPMFDLLGITSSNGVLMFVKANNVAYQAGGSFSVAATFSNMPDFTVNMTNVPDAVSTMNVTRASMINNLPVGPTSVTVPGDPPAGNVSIAVPFPAGFGTRSELSIAMGRPDAQINQQHQAHTAALGTSATVDLGKQQLPWLTNLAATATGATWNMVAAGDPPDGQLTSWSGSWNTGGRQVSMTWLVAQPADMAGMTLPKLPAAYAMLDPGQQTVAVTPSSVTLYMADYDILAGYDQLRQMPETLLTTSIGNMGAFLGMPFQRRWINQTASALIP